MLEIIDPVPAPIEDETRFHHPGRWWHAEGERIVCNLCPRVCVLREGDRGFCFVRQNLGGQMTLTTYGRSTGFCVDPIEKKPLNHFYPGTSVLSFGTAGCNLGCKFCQNWDISKSREIERLSERAGPEDIARAAKALGCRSVAFTYNDPVIWAEYALDTARACREVGLKSVAVTAGYITDEARPEFYAGMDAANVDLKAFTEEFYYKITLSHLEPVLKTLQFLKHETDVWFEITNLLIPQANDDPGEIRRMCDWILENVGDDVPVHFTAFHPDFRMLDRGRTPPETLIAAREIALTQGLHYVYTGNVDDASRQSTYCPQCGNRVIERNWYELGRYDLNGNRCGQCAHTIPGHFDGNGPGDWGRKRLPVDMRTFVRRETAFQAVPSAVGRVSGPSEFGHIAENEDPATASATSVSRATGSTEFGRAGDPSHGRTTADAPANRTSGSTAMKTATLDDLTTEQGVRLVAAAAEVVRCVAQNRPLPALRSELLGHDAEGLGERPVAGIFVSLKRNGHLRACCGTFGEGSALAETLRDSAHRTATNDPRFPPVTAVELPFLDLEVWVLDSPQEVSAQGEARLNEVEVGRHGLQVVRGSRRGLLLPGVPLEHGWDAAEFLRRTCLKAGLPASSWKDDETHLFRFEGRAFRGKCPVESAEAPTPALLTAREVAAYAQYCRDTLTALLSGAVPSYYNPSLTDANVHGVAVFVQRLQEGVSTPEVIASKMHLRQTMPLQATAFALCEELAQTLAAGLVNPAELRIGVAIFSEPALHGTLPEPDLRGVSTEDRALFVSGRQCIECLYDGDRTAAELLADAVTTWPPTEMETASVCTFAVATGRQRFRISRRPRPVIGPEARRPAVAGQFYPGDAAELNQMLDDFLAGDVEPKPYVAAMVPHAGWVFSGRLAADVLRRIEIPRTVIVIGPKHTPHGVDWAVAPHARWSLPGGEVASDRELARRLAERIPGLELDAAAHEQEHGIEVELPILARLAPQVKVVGMTLGNGTAAQLEACADGLADVLRELDELPLLVISSDMNHFATDEETRRLDELALQELDRLDPEGLFRTTTEQHISMCGMRPAVVVLKTLQKLGWLSRSERIGYATSADVTGNPARVVGYAGMLFGA